MPWLRCVLLLLLAACGLQPAPARAQQPLQLDDGRAAVALWPAVAVLRDPGGTLTLAQVLARRQQFSAPTGTPGNLGRSSDAVWLRVPLQVVQATPLHRVLEFDYPPLNRIDVHLLDGAGRVLGSWRMGNELRGSQRPLLSRSHALVLDLPPGRSELLMRVRTTSTMVLPISLRSSEDFTAHESRLQLLQGIFAGLALCMLMYSLTHWISLRDTLFLDYALLLAANMMFVLGYFGIGAMYLWPQWPQLSLWLGPLAVLVAVTAGTRFIDATLGVHELHAALRHTLKGIRLFAVTGAAATLLGLMSYPAAQTLATVLGIAALVASLPASFIRVRRGDVAARYMLIGWALYALGATTLALLLRGHVAPTFWTINFYAFAHIIEMAAWMGVLSLRVQTVRRSADRAQVETETLRALAHTDALTGLPNRRGLQQQLTTALQEATPQRLLALYVLDLNGFKPVNDQHGHDAGDALLVAVGERLTSLLRETDTVARLGGDEFVVLARHLPDAAAAERLHQALQAAFSEPFDMLGRRCSVGAAIGIALAPLQSSHADELFKCADAAMYRSKQAEHDARRGAAHAAAPLQRASA